MGFNRRKPPSTGSEILSVTVGSSSGARELFTRLDNKTGEALRAGMQINAHHNPRGQAVACRMVWPGSAKGPFCCTA